MSKADLLAIKKEVICLKKENDISIVSNNLTQAQTIILIEYREHKAGEYNI
ncbi:MAG: hypothetical protein ABF874_07265 [Liquorilactobacillus nagelii]|uniref:hypothetical protein n=1 Tax=Liquorilactobacillus nagelii TaxID=82688 RepID=UPI0039EC6C77